MTPHEEQYERLIHRIYDTVGNPAGWQTIYADIAAAIGAKTIHVLAFDKGHDALSFSEGFNLPIAGELGYIQRHYRNDPRLALMWAQPVRQWLHCHTHFDDAFVHANRFFQRFLLPLGRRYVSVCKLIDDERVAVMFACLRGAEQGPLAPDAVALLERLTPHLARAVAQQATRYVFSTDDLVGHAFVSRWGQPVILTTTGGEVLRVNGAAERLLQSTSIVHVAGRALILPAPFLAGFLDDCARTEARLRIPDAWARTSAARYRALRIADETDESSESGKTALYAFYNLIVPGEVSEAFGLRPIAMLIFFHPASAPVVDDELLAAAFDLTPAECRVAHWLAEGQSLKEIAERVGVQHDTVRKQLQSIYQKTSTNRQPDLIRLLLHLPGALT